MVILNTLVQLFPNSTRPQYSNVEFDSHPGGRIREIFSECAVPFPTFFTVTFSMNHSEK